MRLTRKQLVGGAAASALAAAGIYELADRLGSAPARIATLPRPPEQHVLDGIRVVNDNDLEVLVPPLHHQVVTATLRVDESPVAQREARDYLEQALGGLEQRFEATPAGLGVTVAWGLPYFDGYVPGQAAKHIPIDRRASAARGHEVGVLEDAIRFPLGIGRERTVAATPTICSALVHAFPGAKVPLSLLLVAIVVGIAVFVLVRRPPRSASAAAGSAATVLAAGLLLAPAARTGYLAYPIDLAVWAFAMRSVHSGPGAVPEP